MAAGSPADMLGASALFGALAETDRQAVAARMRPVAFGTGQSIFSRGDPGRDIYLVLAGRVRLSILTGEGRELALAHAAKGEIFGEIAALDGGPRTADATAISAVKAQLLPQPALAELIDRNPRIAAAAIRFLCGRLRETDHKLEAIALHPIEVRLARFLLSAIRLQQPAAARAAGGKGARDPGDVALDLGMSQSELALLIGASRPKVNIALTQLEDLGAVTRDGALLVCNRTLLEDIALAGE